MCTLCCNVTVTETGGGGDIRASLAVTIWPHKYITSTLSMLPIILSIDSCDISVCVVHKCTNAMCVHDSSKPQVQRSS